MMKTEEIIAQHGHQALRSFLAYDDTSHQARPLVMVMPDWSGRNAFACEKAKMLASLGYIGLALDLYGDGQVGETNQEKTILMAPLIENRAFLRERLMVHFEQTQHLPYVDLNQIGAMGFCFGGLCALDLARSGALLKGVVSFHGLLNAPIGLPKHAIQAKVLALHGYDDPMVRPDAVQSFCEEMTAAGVDWQVHMYGHTKHAFTNPLAHDEALGTVYNHCAESRALTAMENFWQEIFDRDNH